MVSRRKIRRRWQQWLRWENRLIKLSRDTSVTRAHMRTYNQLVAVNNRRHETSYGDLH